MTGSAHLIGNQESNPGAKQTARVLANRQPARPKSPCGNRQGIWTFGHRCANLLLDSCAVNRSSPRQERAVCPERIFSFPPPHSKIFNFLELRQATNVNRASA